MEMQNGSGGAANGSTSLSRAEKFEAEKRRIIDSCFGKKDEDGSLLESYITHIRIIEDAAYPSSPPPPDANPAQKKERLIIVAVRKSGRVRMHKARENPNKSFSIGKTWMLDDLTAVQSYSGPTSSPQEEQQKAWAGVIGFTVSIGKPYYWQANTQKEKQFFIASLVKIYTKYTGGKSPDLIGFDTRERDQLAGVAPTQRPPPPSLQAGPAPGPNGSYGSQPRPMRRDPSREPPVLRKQPSREAVQRPPQGQIPPLPPTGSSFTSQTQRPQFRNQRMESPAGSIESSGTGNLQNQPPLRRLAAGNQSQESFGRSDDGSSLPPRSRGGMSGTPNVPGRFPERSVTPSSQRATTPDSSLSGPREQYNDVPPVPAPLSIPPERRRPPMPIIGDSRQRGQTPSNDNIVPAPLSSPGMRRDDLKLPMRNGDRTSPRDRDPENDSTQAKANGYGKPDAAKEVVMEQPPPEEPKAITPEPPVVSPVSPAESPAIPVPPEPEEDIRPGLGPMIKKKSKGDIAGSFLRAAKQANAFNSFKPRAGGAAERMREAALAAKSSDGPDGINAVVPAPSLLRTASGDGVKLPPPLPLTEKAPPPKSADRIPEVKITVPPNGRPSSVEGPLPTPKDGSLPEKASPREVKRTKTAAERCNKELMSIGIDPTIIGDRGGDLVDAWEQFGWTPGEGGGMRTKNIDQMRDEIERELNKVQAGGWLARLEQEDDRIKAVHDGLDKCIEECDEFDALLTLYSVELGTLNEDIAYIEAQSQGLQVQAANQKLLQTELQTLLSTISISSDQLDYLRESSLESSDSIAQIEASLVMLFKAILTIDPSLSISVARPSNDGSSLSSGRPGGFGNSELGSMRVLQEKKDVYKNEISMFLRRLKPFLQIKFQAAVMETVLALEREKKGQMTRVAGKARLDPRHHDLSRDLLWRYSPLLLFSREVDRMEWEELLKMYESVSQKVYQEEFREALFAWKRIVRKATGDEADLLFTSQTEKQTDGIVTTTRKLTVKRSQTLAKSLRSPLGDNSSRTTIDKTDGRLQPYEVFSGLLDEILPLITMEQNFIVEFFHISSLEQYDFPEAVAAAPPEARRGGDLRRHRVMEPNRDLAKIVIQSMEEVYSFFLGDVQGLVDWAVQADPLQGVGVLAFVERKLAGLEESSQEYLSRTLQKLHQKLMGLFTKFLDEQIRAIEDTKVKINKRKGVIAFIRVFPSFSLAVETMLTTSHDLEIRQTVNQAYIRINKTMFESLKVIARENPGAQIAGADPEDKEALNYQILLIENMNHYLEEVDTRANPVLEDWKQNAGQEMEEHMGLYLGAVIRRPLGKLLDFLESTESLMLSRQPGDSFSKISNMPSHSKTTFKKVLASYDSKEIRKGIEQLKKRVEKHFGDADDPNLSRGLVNKVLQNCEKYYEKVEDRILTISRDVYDGEAIAEWARADVSAAFRK